MIPSLITDELSADPESAIELGCEWGVRDYELRGVFTDRAPLLSAYQRRCIVETLKDHDARIFAVSPGLFKIPHPATAPTRSNLGWMERAFFESWENAHQQLRHHVGELLPAALDYAAELGAQYVVSFGFHRGGLPGGAPPEDVIACLAEATAAARRHGLELLIETEEGFWADTGERSAAMVAQINDPALGINWDPANSFCEGDRPFPNGYAAVRPFVRNVHFKDARRLPDGGGEFVLEGEIDWAGQIAALRVDGYAGHISIEPHLRPRIASVRHSLERLRRLIEQAATGDRDRR